MTKQFGLRMPESLLKTIKKMAEQQNRSTANMIIRLLKKSS